MWYRIVKSLCGLGVSTLLVACSSHPDWLMQKRKYADWEFTPKQVNSYSFKWSMQGDPSLFPTQVFSTQSEVWIQWGTDRPLPVLLAVSPKTQQEKVLNYFHNPPYLVVKGGYEQLVLRLQQKEVKMQHRP